MGEKRGAARTRRRLIVDFNTPLSKTTGFTHDVSRSGLFIRTIQIPKIGNFLRAVLHLPDGRHLPIEGTVVRSHQAPSQLRALVPSGFGLKISKDSNTSREYDEFASNL